MKIRHWLSINEKKQGHSNSIFGGSGIGQYGPITEKESNKIMDERNKNLSKHLSNEFEKRIAGRNRDSAMFVIDRTSDLLGVEFKNWMTRNKYI